MKDDHYTVKKVLDNINYKPIFKYQLLCNEKVVAVFNDEHSALSVRDCLNERYSYVPDVVDANLKLQKENEQLQIKIADLQYDNRNYKINLNDQKQENKELKQSLKEARAIIERSNALIKELEE